MAARAWRTRSGEGARIARPSSPSTTTSAPGGAASRSSPSATTIGTPSERATIAACAVTAPRTERRRAPRRPARRRRRARGRRRQGRRPPRPARRAARRNRRRCGPRDGRGCGRRPPEPPAWRRPRKRSPRRACRPPRRGPPARERRLQDGGLDGLSQQGILRHQHARLDDLRLGRATARPQAPGHHLQPGRGGLEGGGGPRRLIGPLLGRDGGCAQRVSGRTTRAAPTATPGEAATPARTRSGISDPARRRAPGRA